MDKFTLLSISSMIFRVATFPFFFYIYQWTPQIESLFANYENAKYSINVDLSIHVA